MKTRCIKLNGDIYYFEGDKFCFKDSQGSLMEIEIIEDF